MKLLVETCPLSASREWRRLLPAADLVLTDLRTAPALEKLRPRRLHVARLIPPASVERLRVAASVVVPGASRPHRRRRR